MNSGFLIPRSRGPVGLVWLDCPLFECVVCWFLRMCFCCVCGLFLRGTTETTCGYASPGAGNHRTYEQWFRFGSFALSRLWLRFLNFNAPLDVKTTSNNWGGQTLCVLSRGKIVGLPWTKERVVTTQLAGSKENARWAPIVAQEIQLAYLRFATPSPSGSALGHLLCRGSGVKLLHDYNG